MVVELHKLLKRTQNVNSNSVLMQAPLITVIWAWHLMRLLWWVMLATTF